MSIPINFWTIIVSMICSVVLGFIWYGPLFGKPWMKLSGIHMPATKPGFSVMIKPIIISLVGAFFMAFVLKHNLTFAMAYLNYSPGISAGLSSAFWNWLGFIVPATLAHVAWEGKPWKLWMIHAGYWLVLLGIMGMILATWM